MEVTMRYYNFAPSLSLLSFNQMPLLQRIYLLTIYLWCADAGENFGITEPICMCEHAEDCGSCGYGPAEPPWFADSSSSNTCLGSSLCSNSRQNRRRTYGASPGFPTCHRATLFSRNDSGLLFPLFSLQRILLPHPARDRLAARPLSSFSRPFASRYSFSFPSPSSFFFLRILLFLLTTVLDAVQVQSERRDTIPTFPWRWLEAGSITDFGKSCIYDAVTRDRGTLLHGWPLVTFKS